MTIVVVALDARQLIVGFALRGRFVMIILGRWLLTEIEKRGAGSCQDQPGVACLSSPGFQRVRVNPRESRQRRCLLEKSEHGAMIARGRGRGHGHVFVRC